MINMETIIAYLPTVLEAVITGLICYFLKQLGNHSSKIDVYKNNVLDTVSNVSNSFNSALTTTSTEIAQISATLKESASANNLLAEELKSLKTENTALYERLAKQDKQLTEIEALLRKE